MGSISGALKPLTLAALVRRKHSPPYGRGDVHYTTGLTAEGVRDLANVRFSNSPDHQVSHALGELRMKFFSSLDDYQKFIACACSMICFLLFILIIRDLLVPYRTQTFVKGSIYEALEPAEPGDKAIQVNIR